jgi:hypothetical protein
MACCLLVPARDRCTVGSSRMPASQLSRSSSESQSSAYQKSTPHSRECFAKYMSLLLPLISWLYLSLADGQGEIWGSNSDQDKKKRIGYLPKRPTFKLLGGWINEHPARDEEL